MKHFRKVISVFLFFVLLIFVSGCGEGHHHEEAVFPLSPDIRTFQLGDTIDYFMTSTDRLTGAFFDGNVRWQIFSTTTSFSGLTCLVFDITGVLASHTPGLPSQDFRTGGLLFQNSFGDLFSCGNFNPFTNTVNLIVSSDANPDALMPILINPVAVGDFQISTVTFQDGSVETCSFSVEAIERVSTIRGTFDAFRVRQVCVDSLGNPLLDSVNWFYPPIYNVKGFSTDFVFNFDDTIDMIDFHLF